MGEDLSKLDIFDDRQLFSLIFCDYYPLFEPKNCFVAVDQHNQPVGYLIGTLDTKRQEQTFLQRFLPYIVKHLLVHTLWQHPYSFIQTLKFVQSFDSHTIDLHRYPSHFHVNILPGFQGAGIGKRLLQRFESHCRAHGIAGIHLTTSSYNRNAIGFYQHQGFQLVQTSSNNLWQISGIERVIMVKSLTS